jgi:hypothetical protein
MSRICHNWSCLTDKVFVDQLVSAYKEGGSVSVKTAS